MVYWVIEMMTNGPASASRYSVACPVCAARFHPFRAKGITKFACPECEELLEYVPRNDWLFLLLSMAGGIALTVHWGYSGFTFAFWGDCGRLVDTLCGRGRVSLHPPATSAAMLHDLAIDR
jgi:hypothetical protein